MYCGTSCDSSARVSALPSPSALSHLFFRNRDVSGCLTDGEKYVFMELSSKGELWMSESFTRTKSLDVILGFLVKYALSSAFLPTATTVSASSTSCSVVPSVDSVPIPLDDGARDPVVSPVRDPVSVFLSSPMPVVVAAAASAVSDPACVFAYFSRN